MFEGFSAQEIYGLAWLYTISSAVEKIYVDNPVKSDTISINEILTIHTKAVIDFISGWFKGEDLNYRASKYEAVMNFISSITTPV